MSMEQTKPSIDGNIYKPGEHPELPPPPGTVGVVGWIRNSFFDGWKNTILTLLCLWLLWAVIPPTLNFLFFDAVVSADNRVECAELGDGACWAFVIPRIDQFTFGDYPASERWRPVLTFFFMLLALVPILADKVPYRKQLLWFSMAFPVIGYILIFGGPTYDTVNEIGITTVHSMTPLEPVGSDKLGGILLTLVLGITGITMSFPLGVILALGRYNKTIPAVQIICVGFIEFIRGVPLITLLFVASTMLNYFLPPGTTFDLLLRVVIMVILFASAYMAEVIRGGLQAIPKGQFEAADAMGLTYWQSMRLIILPQALKISIPGIVNTFIGLYKDTTLVLIIGLLDMLGTGKALLSDPEWNGLALEVYVFTAIFFFVTCYSMSLYSRYLEKKLNTGHKR